VRGKGAYDALKRAQDLANRDTDLGYDAGGLKFKDHKIVVKKNTVVDGDSVTGSVTQKWDSGVQGFSVTWPIGEVTESNSGSGYFNLGYIPFGKFNGNDWTAFKSASAYKTLYNGEGLPRWIIRNGINDAEQDGNTYFSSFKKWDGTINGNGAVCFAGIGPDGDADGDDFPNWWEVEYGYDPHNPADPAPNGDDDKDGLTNQEEYEYKSKDGKKTDPRNPDTDGDGFLDGWEVNNGHDPTDATDPAPDEDDDEDPIAAGTPVTGVTLSSTTKELAVNGRFSLTAAIAPPGAANRNVTWSFTSSPSGAVSLSSTTGSVITVTGKKAGTAAITVTTSNGNKTASCAVTVKEVRVTGVSITPSSLTVSVNSTGSLYASFTPSDATNQAVSWSSADQSIATVDSGGTVTGKKAGTTTITVITSDGNKTATRDVTVIIPVTGVTVTPAALTIGKGKTGSLSAQIKPDDATDGGVTWSSDDQSIATVDSSGMVTGVEGGTTTITATSRNGKTAKCTITVAAVTIGVSTYFFKDSDGPSKWSASITPASANQSVTWKSDDPAIVTVAADGTLTPVKAGNTRIRATSDAYGCSANEPVFVIARVTGFTVSGGVSNIYISVVPTQVLTSFSIKEIRVENLTAPVVMNAKEDGMSAQTPGKASRQVNITRSPSAVSVEADIVITVKDNYYGTLITDTYHYTYTR
jgi:uncharacterized protein YjdB